jgi:hypothetical protein
VSDLVKEKQVIEFCLAVMFREGMEALQTFFLQNERQLEESGRVAKGHC